DCASDKLFVDIWAVYLGGVDERHAEIERAVAGADGLGVIGSGSGISVGHAHGAQADSGDGQVTQFRVFHRVCSFVVPWRCSPRGWSVGADGMVTGRRPLGRGTQRL